MSEKSANIAVKNYLQTAGLCGPASLKILFSYFGKDFTEAQLAQLASATQESGTEHEGMIRAVKAIGAHAFEKEGGTLEELEYFIKEEKLPVIIGWFDKDGDHYSVVVNITDKNIIIVDPAVNEPERWLDRETFPQILFDFVGKDNRVVSWGWYLIATFEKKEYKIKGGNYF